MELLKEETIGGLKVKYFRFGKLVVGIATNIGPRIMHLSLSGKEEDNVFGVVPDFSIQTPEGIWKIYGGHRLWVSPEAMSRSYSLDNEPIKLIEEDNEIVILGNPEPKNSVRKAIRLKQGPDSYSLTVTHEIKNIGRWPIRFSCWALSVMTKGGSAMIPVWPHKADEGGLLPDRILSLWPYTKLDDERLTFTSRYILLKQDPSITEPVKIGASAYPYWTAYYVKGKLFLKSFSRLRNEYPDYGVYVEAFTNKDFLELETLGPLREVLPGDVNTHVENWRLTEIHELSLTDDELDQAINKLTRNSGCG